MNIVKRLSSILRLAFGVAARLFHFIKQLWGGAGRPNMLLFYEIR